ncbi:tyrosinase family protein [Microbacterium sp. P5_E9]
MKARTPRLDQFRELFRQALATATEEVGLDPQLTAAMGAIAMEWSDPLSLGYQSQVHGTYAVDRSRWPRFKRKKVLWEECAHNQWFFLPWHRAYLAEFEIVVRRHIEDLGGPAADWALPYWNYTDYQADPKRLGLPLPLRGAAVPPGVQIPGLEPIPGQPLANPLFEPTRELRGDQPPGASPGWASAAIALRRPHYANQNDTGMVSLGGGVIEKPNNPKLFHGGGERGFLDNQPHGSTHGHVGGFMGEFETAALDPTFWVHHCNVDRLWETYAHDLGHGYPFEQGEIPPSNAKKSWTSHKFKFLRADGTVKEYTANAVTDVATLDYRYAETAPPPLAPVAPAPRGAEIDPFGIAPPALAEPLASARDVVLHSSTHVPLHRPAPERGQRALVAGSFPGDTQWSLRMTGVRSAVPARTSFDVYLGLGGADADPHDLRHYCGGLSLFGAYEATVDNDASTSDGVNQMFDVTEQIGSQGGNFLIDGAVVTFFAVDPDRSTAGISIDQITLEFS